MIRAIVAIDEKRGLAKGQVIPWYLPGDLAYFKQKTENSTVLMGYRTYLTLHGPLSSRRNVVASKKHVHLKDGFELVADPVAFLKTATQDIWNIGGGGLLAATLDLCEELYITQVVGDFGCTVFMPEYKDRYTRMSQSQAMTENGIRYRFEVWEHMSSA